jgi:hypothetical protein
VIILGSGKVLIPADVRHGGENFGKPAASRATQSRPQNLAVLLLGTAFMFGRTLFESFHQLVREIANHELRHGPLLSLYCYQ